MNVADAPSAAMADVTPDLPGRLGVAVQMLAHAGKVSGGRADLTPTRLTALAIMALAGPMRMGTLAARSVWRHPRCPGSWTYSWPPAGPSAGPTRLTTAPA